jgi:hypothetical protein
MIRVIERRIRRLEKRRQRRAEAGQSPAEVIRERQQKQLLAEGKEPEPDPLPLRRVDENGRPSKMGEIIRKMRRNRQP